MSNLFKTTLRINLSRPEGRRAWGYLVARDKSKYRSYSETREKEDAFLQKVLDTVERGVQANSLNSLAVLFQNTQLAAPAPDQAAIEQDLDTAMDFINGL